MAENNGKGCLAWIVIIVVIAVPVGIRKHNRDSKLQPFITHVEEYKHLADSAAQNLEWPDQKPASGKFIVVDLTTDKIDKIYFKLPEPFRAITPEEVQTIIFLKTFQTRVGSYTNGASAFRETRSVTVIDRQSARIIAETSFSDDPPQTISHSGSGSGTVEDKEIVDFIKTLYPK